MQSKHFNESPRVLRRLGVLPIERFDRTVRYDWLAQELFDIIDEAQNQATRWMWHYNHERPNMAVGGITPDQRLAIAA